MLGKGSIQVGQGVITRAWRWRTDTLESKMNLSYLLFKNMMCTVVSVARGLIEFVLYLLGEGRAQCNYIEAINPTNSPGGTWLAEDKILYSDRARCCNTREQLVQTGSPAHWKCHVLLAPGGVVPGYRLY